MTNRPLLHRVRARQAGGTATKKYEIAKRTQFLAAKLRVDIAPRQGLRAYDSMSYRWVRFGLDLPKMEMV
jgi:hypothetical protein